MPEVRLVENQVVVDRVDGWYAAWNRSVRDDNADAETLDLLRRLARETDADSAARLIARELHARVWIFDEPEPRVFGDEGDGNAVTCPIAIEDDRPLGALTMAAEEQRVARIARLVAPALAMLELERRAAERHTAIREDVARLYRGEALEQYQRGRTDEAHLLELEPRWTRYAYGVLLALLVAALAFSALVKVDRYAEGFGIVREGRLVCVMNARDRAQLRVGQPVGFEHTKAEAKASALHSKVIAAADARRLLGPDGARLWTTTDPAIRVEADAPRDFADGVTGRVRVRLGRERLLLTWVRRG